MKGKEVCKCVERRCADVDDDVDGDGHGAGSGGDA
jgi:hypothetical protein